MKTTSEILYAKRERQTAIKFCPSINPCMKCDSPVVDGFCCEWCGDTNPRHALDGTKERSND